MPSPDELPYRYAWDRCGRKGQPCQVTARGTMNSACVVFADGFSMVTSRNALRRRRSADQVEILSQAIDERPQQ